MVLGFNGFMVLWSGMSSGLNPSVHPPRPRSRMDKDEEGAVEPTEYQQYGPSKTLLERIAPEAAVVASSIDVQKTRGPSPEKTEITQSEASHSEKPQDGQSRAPSPSRNRKTRGGRGRRRSPGPPPRPPQGVPLLGYRDGRRGRSRGEFRLKALFLHKLNLVDIAHALKELFDAVTTHPGTISKE